MTNTTTPRARLAIGTSALLLSVTAGLLACGDRSDQHASDGDSGAAAPATVRNMDATPMAGDSTAGVARATGQPQPLAGDTTGARALDTLQKKP